MANDKIQVIMLQDVKNIGRKNEILNVAPSYAQHVLFKNGYAKIADKNIIDKIARDKAKKQEWQHTLVSQLETLLVHLKETWHTISGKVSPAGKLYAKIDNKTLAQSLSEVNDFTIESSRLTCDKIDHTGDYDVKLQFGAIKSSFVLTVVWTK